jgi:anti-sigma regulatory factor (Ser/Thr protein kinase)
MTGIRARGEDIRRFILQKVEKHPTDISRVTAHEFGITRQAVNKHLQRLTLEGCLLESGKTRNRSYKPRPLARWNKVYTIEPGLQEDVIWENDIRPALGELPDNARNILHIGFTEIFNNALEHSEGTQISVAIGKTATNTELVISDNGVGIFKKIATALNLADERHAVLELAKGKFTTDAKHHSGEGIFFSSRMFDYFIILAGGVSYSHHYGKDENDWILEREPSVGTTVYMDLNNHTARTARQIYNEYASGENYGFNKTVVPVRLAQFGSDQLVSRSQAKRLLSRIELFRVVILDFEGVESIGQAFADEIFRVFASAHPGVELVPDNMSEEVQQMIARSGFTIQGATQGTLGI